MTNNDDMGKQQHTTQNQYAFIWNYNAYVENKSYLSRDGDQWYWNVELADRIGVKMLPWIPSENLSLRVRHYLNDEQVKYFKDIDGLQEYLAALPDSIGTGNYTFTYQIPVEVGQPGEYYFDSYIGEFVNEEMVSYCCPKTYRFTVDDLTGIQSLTAEDINDKSSNSNWFDLQGRPLSGKPTRSGLYIQGNKKIFVK